MYPQEIHFDFSRGTLGYICSGKKQDSLDVSIFFGLHRFLVGKEDSMDVKSFFWSSPILGVHERIHKLSKGTDEQKVWETLTHTMCA